MTFIKEIAMKSMKQLAWIFGVAGTALLSLALSSQAYSQSYPEIDFSSRPNYLPNNAISLTFDDAPDWNNTAQILDILRDKKVKATFFLNAENWSSLSADSAMQDLVRRMVNEGHELANHSSHHLHIASLTDSEIEAELSSVETAVQSILGPKAPRLTLFRAPFGEPYQLSDVNNRSSDYLRVAPIIAKHAVHVGWAIDAFDYNCPNGECVINNVVSKIKTPGTGDYGSVLLHSVHAQTVEGLPGLIDYIRNNGFQFWTTEQLVKARYGKSSAELVDGGSSKPVSASPPVKPTQPNQPASSDCDSAAWTQGKWYNVGDKVVYNDQVFTAQNEPNPGYDPIISYWFWAAGPKCN
jgi:peptidoglycan/xylan/chitin deacetylase (PgdA/CDA1 family)